MSNYAHEQTESVSALHAMSELHRATNAPDVADDDWLAGIPHDRPRDMAQETADVARLVDLQDGQRAAAQIATDAIVQVLSDHGPSMSRPNQCICNAVIHDESQFRGHLALCIQDASPIFAADSWYSGNRAGLRDGLRRGHERALAGLPDISEQYS